MDLKGKEWKLSKGNHPVCKECYDEGAEERQKDMIKASQEPLKKKKRGKRRKKPQSDSYKPQKSPVTHSDGKKVSQGVEKKKTSRKPPRLDLSKF